MHLNIPPPISSSKVWTTQPQGVVGVAPLLRITSMLHPLNGSFRAEIGPTWTTNASSGLSGAITKNGRAVTNSGTAYLSRTSDVVSGPVSIGLIFTPSTIIGTGGLWSMSSGYLDTATGQILLQRNGTDLRVLVAGVYRNTFTGICVVGKPLVIVYSQSNVTPSSTGVTARLTVNGVQLVSSGLTNGATSYTSEFFMAGYNGQPAGDYQEFFQTKSEISASDALNLTSSPSNFWQLFAPQQRKVWVPVSQIDGTSSIASKQPVSTKESMILESSNSFQKRMVAPILSKPMVLSKQPQGAVRLKSNYAKAVCILSGRNISTVPVGLTYGVGISPSGVGMKFDPKTSQTLTIAPVIIGTGDFTVAKVVYVGVTQTYSYNYASGYSSGAALCLHLSTGGDAVTFYVGGHVNSGIVDRGPGLKIVVVSRRSGVIYFNINGKTASVSSAGNVGTISSICVNDYAAGSLAGLDGTSIHLLDMVEGRGWVDAEISDFVANPWRIFAPRSGKIWIPN